ncbi:hypothetical protein EGH25_09185 [Haladaptatus sp. F3-133]|uniref:Uncharacterized protein n=1 Tax=Halorutilus salinus TaxID=2487751 RepID=A0A9Q4C5C6_9EURY|nr:hypothetical protein [Halorutilus salinus]MCX2819521.1 hypothetical protein [Halorutilus salinus]
MRSNGGRSGQTSVDFLVGVSIFAVTLLFVLQLATGSAVNLSPDTQTEGALADRTGDVLLSDWSDAEPGVFGNTTAEDYLDRSYTDVADDLNIPKEGGNYLYRYNVTVVELEELSEEPPEPVEPGSVELTAGNSTTDATGTVAGRNRVAYMNTTGGGDMVGVRVKVW